MGKRNRKRFLSAGIFTVLFISSITILAGCKDQKTATSSAPSIPLYPQWDGKAGDTNQANFWAGKGNGKFGAYCGSELQVSVRSGDFLLTYSTLQGTFRIAFRAEADSLLHVGLQQGDRVTEASLQHGNINGNISQSTSWQSDSVTLFAWPGGGDSLAWDDVITLDTESAPIHLIEDGKVLPSVEQLPAPKPKPNPPATTTPATTPTPTPIATVTPDPCVVTTEADSGAGSLRQVLANTPCCTNITFAGGVNSITLAGTQLEIPGTCTNLTIDGGSGVTISGNNASRVFAVKPNATVSFENLHITQGITTDPFYGGGGILIDTGNVTIGTGTTVSKNSAMDGGGIANHYGKLLVKGVVNENTATHNGGGIYNSTGNVTIGTGTTVSKNSARDGGGIANHGGQLLVKGAVSENTATDNGGGIYGIHDTVSVEGIVKDNTASGFGGGLDLSLGTHTVTGTVTENIAELGGGGINCSDSTVIVSGSVTQNQAISADSGGGGIRSIASTLFLSGTVSGNHAAHGGGIATIFKDTVNFEPGNLIENNQASTVGGGISISADIVNITGTPVGIGNTPNNCTGVGCPAGW